MSDVYAFDDRGISREAESVPAAPGVLTKAPELLKAVEAPIPPGILLPGESVEVVLQIDIDAQGKVTHVEVTSAPNPALDELAKSALLLTEFTPAEVDGKPALVRIEYRYRFEVLAPPPPEVEKPVNLKGRVLERGTRNPLRGAVVYIPEQNLTAETDAQGHFELRGITLGKTHIRITELKHRKYEITEDIPDGQVVEITAYLLKNIAGGAEIVVVGERDKKDVVKRVLQKEELKSVPGTLGDPLRVLQSLPGMGRPAFISGALIVRGSRPNDSQVLIDGVPVPLLFHFGAGPSVITPSFIEAINFYPGVFGPKYGHAIGGVVDVDTHVPKITRMHGEVKIDMLDARFYTETPLGENSEYGTLTLAARRSYVDAWLPLAIKAATPAGQGSVIAIPYYWDYQGRYSLSAAGHRFEATTFGSNDVLKISTTGVVPAQNFSLNSATGFHRTRLLWTTTLSDGWNVSVAPMVGTTPTSTDVNELLKVNVDSIDIGLRGFARKEFSPDVKFEIGAEGFASRYQLRFETAGYPTAADPNPAPAVREQNIYGGAGAVYTEIIWVPKQAWKIIPGLRVEEYKLPGGYTTSLEPRFAARYDISDTIALKGGAGLYRQTPLPQRLDRILGNPYLSLEQSEQLGGGAEFQLTPGIFLDMQTYYSRRSNLSVASRDIVLRDGAYVPENFNNTGTGHAYGLEILLKHDVTERFYGWLSYTWSRAEDFNKTIGTYVPSTYDQTHMAALVASYKFAKGWEIGTRYRMTTGRPVTPVIGATYDADNNRYTPVYGAPGSARGATFSQLDARVERLWTYDQWKLAAYLDIQNIFNSENPEATLWDYRYAKSSSLRGLPILPVLGIRGEF
ncbi:MAG: TonB-dependent receptor [Pseudomonadota bacterium]